MTLKVIINDDLDLQSEKIMSEMNSWGQTCIEKWYCTWFTTPGKKVTF